MKTNTDNQIIPKKVNVHKFHRQRLRDELILNGFNTSEHKVLEYLLFLCHAQKDVNPLSHELINKFGSFKNVLEASYSDLIKIKDVGDVTAKILTSIVPIFNYYNNQKLNLIKTKMQTRKDYVNYFNAKVKDLSHESLLLIALNDKYEVKNSKVLKIGNDTKVEIDYIDIITFLANNSSNKAVLMHNHPSGNSTPSDADIKNTKEIMKSLGVVGLEIIDHVIVSNSGYYSFAEQNKIDEFVEDLRKNRFIGDNLYKK